MGRRRSRQDEPGLFDLPLDGPEPTGEEVPDEAPAPDRREPRAAEPGSVADPAAGPGEAPSGAAPDERAGPAAEAPTGDRTGPGSEEVAGVRRGPAGAPPLSARYLAGLADLAVHLAFGVALLYGARGLGADAGLADWPALLPVLAVFSFLYTILTLAFWGQTPGMAWAGVVTRTAGDHSLTFGQTARRWLGGLLSAALLGLPTLLAAGGRRSLADRLSDSDLRAL